MDRFPWSEKLQGVQLKVTVSLLLPLFLFLSPSPPAKTASSATDGDYVSALAAANRFLHAWQTQDHEAGLLMLTNAAKRHTSEENLEVLFAGGPATQQAFEIRQGKKLKAGRYMFTVALFDIRRKQKWIQPRLCQIVVVRTVKDDWAIDKLP